MNEKEKTLSELFQAPLDIITQTGFDEVFYKSRFYCCNDLCLKVFCST